MSKRTDAVASEIRAEVVSVSVKVFMLCLPVIHRAVSLVLSLSGETLENSLLSTFNDTKRALLTASKGNVGMSTRELFRFCLRAAFLGITEQATQKDLDAVVSPRGIDILCKFGRVLQALLAIDAGTLRNTAFKAWRRVARKALHTTESVDTVILSWMREVNVDVSRIKNEAAQREYQTFVDSLVGTNGAKGKATPKRGTVAYKRMLTDAANSAAKARAEYEASRKANGPKLVAKA